MVLGKEDGGKDHEDGGDQKNEDQGRQDVAGQVFSDQAQGRQGPEIEDQLDDSPQKKGHHNIAQAGGDGKVDDNGALHFTVVSHSGEEDVEKEGKGNVPDDELGQGENGVDDPFCVVKSVYVHG